ncbi:hypothetical protein [Leuconostoc mesenteroides]|uniref:hypothetical protein n=1 Tax=Leuconostoc mesenteroides TaxID=1245 RepID=UPI000B9D7DE0|nr:hypothetical protein [Leuconostoc mesenteroides]BAX71516.1 acetyltransferase [Leuconostoc mesenteroides]
MEFEIVPYNDMLNKSDLDGYETGFPGLDNFVSEEINDFEKANRSALSVAYYNGIVVGMYALSVTQTVISNNHTEKVLGKKMDRSPLISLDHFSVNKKFQYDPKKEKSEQLSVGKNLLYEVFKLMASIRRVQNVAISGMFACAIPDAVDWYCDRGFDFISDDERDAINKDCYQMIIGYPFMEKSYLEAKDN